MASLRDKYPRAQLPLSHMFLTLSHGESIKTWAIRPAMLYAALAIGPLLGICGVAGGTMMALHTPFKHDASSNELVANYESKLKGLSSQLEEAQSRALVSKSTLEGKINELLTRQAQVEAKQSIVASLTEAALPEQEVRKAAAAKAAAVDTTPTASLPKSVSGFADVPPAARPMPLLDGEQKAPGAFGPQVSLPSALQVAGFGVVGSENAPFKALESSSAKIELAENKQIMQLDALAAATDKSIATQKQALSNAGLSLDKLAAAKGSIGGPYVPMKVNPNGSSFERAVFRAQSLIEEAAKLKKIMPYVPLRHPLAEGAEITSGFGGRVDPFNGQMAMHTGLDFRLAYGAPVHPTASGTVVSAGPDGGYGNAIDVDHGNGLVTRYGHLSAVLVKEGDVVTPSSVIGRLGSTGRSTGPHLHYEVRINDEPVNPIRFLKAGEPLFSKG